MQSGIEFNISGISECSCIMLLQNKYWMKVFFEGEAVNVGLNGQPAK
jgi:hypothetical protein